MFDFFYKPIKIPPAKKVFWTSDTHFGHACPNWEKKLWAGRGFSSVEEMDAAQIKAWNETVSPEDIVFHLGDFCLGEGSEQRFAELIKILNFETLYSMAGNHPAGWHQCYKRSVNGEYFVGPNKKVVFVPNYLELIYRSQIIVMSHYPIASFNKVKDFAWMCYGHSHNNLDLDLGKCVDVGYDRFKKPVGFEELADIMNQKEQRIFDHHHD